MAQGHKMQFDSLDVLGLAVAGSLVASPSWYEHLLDWMPAPTAVYAFLGSVYILVQILDKMELLPRFGRKDKSKD